MKTQTIEKTDAQWLRKHATETGDTAMTLMPSLRNVKYTTIYKWLQGSEPRTRPHRRALAAYRRRVEAANG